jgi:hypothetical protein
MQSIHDVLVGLEAPHGMILPGRYWLVDAKEAELAVDPEKHAGAIIKLDSTDGVAATLPAATGTGHVYRFYVQTPGNATTIKCAGSDVLYGQAMIAAPAEPPAGKKKKHHEEEVEQQAAGGLIMHVFLSAGDSNTLTLGGGEKGDTVRLVDVGPGEWSVALFLQAPTGTPSSPFSATEADNGKRRAEPKQGATDR